MFSLKFIYFSIILVIMAKHPRHVEGFEGSLEQLAKSIGNMTYDQASSFIEKLADDIKKQADADFARGRKKLASELYATVNELYQARDKMDLAWKICEPYMKDYNQKLI
jgi:molybdenum-dependent DNA-binding transcriptional regulator ModE